jgi:hypothetical protein
MDGEQFIRTISAKTTEGRYSRNRPVIAQIVGGILTSVLMNARRYELGKD